MKTLVPLTLHILRLALWVSAGVHFYNRNITAGAATMLVVIALKMEEV